MILAIVGSGQPARAQDEQPEENPQLKPQANPIRPALPDEMIDRWAFGPFGKTGDVQSWLDSALAVRVEEVERACGITADQKKKLQLVGRIEIQRFFERMDMVRQRARELGRPADPIKVNAIIQEAAELRQLLEVPWFQEGSLFFKVFNNTLTEEQFAKYQQIQRDRRLFRHRASVRWVAFLLAESMGWSDDQRQRFEKVLLDEIPPPKRFPGNPDISNYNVVMYQAARVPEAKLRPIFDDLQWRLLSRQFRYARRLEFQLKNNGFVPGEEPARTERPGSGESSRKSERVSEKPDGGAALSSPPLRRGVERVPASAPHASIPCSPPNDRLSTTCVTIMIGSSE
jgi:hypothetical protein